MPAAAASQPVSPLLSASDAKAGSGQISVRAPRNFGFVMGDVITSEIKATVPAGYSLDAPFLPRAGVLDEWLEIRDVRWQQTSAGASSAFLITVRYQVFKGVRAVERATAPAVPVRFLGPAPLALTAPAWEFTIQPLISPQLDDAAVIIREGLDPPLPDGSIYVRRLLGLLGAALLAGSYLGWHWMAARRRNRPFGRSQRAMGQLLKVEPPDPGRYREALRLMHRALDESAGQPVFATQIDEFLKKRPEFAALRLELVRFFNVSDQLFFASPDGSIPAGTPPGWLLELSRRCAGAERGKR